MKKKIIGFIILLLLGYVGYTKLFPTTATVTYKTAKVEKGTIISSVSASGTVSSSYATSVNTQASGTIKSVLVKAGELVTAGQTIAEITMDQQGSQNQQSAWASYLSAKNTLDSANATLYSLQSLMFVANAKFKDQAVASGRSTDDPIYVEQQADWLAAEAKYKNQQGAIAAATAGATSSWLTYLESSPTITAPVAGTISGVLVTPGIAIASTSSTSSTGSTSSSSTKIATIASDSSPVISVNVSEIDVPKISADQKVTITFDAFVGKTYTGSVLGVDTAGVVSSGVTTYPVHIVLESGVPNLYPNMAAQATIITEIKKDVLIIPSSAVTTQNGESTVQLYNNGNPQVTLVTTGIASDTSIEIVSGLSEGDEIVTSSSSSTTTSTTSTGTSPFSSTIRTPSIGGSGNATRRQ